VFQKSLLFLTGKIPLALREGEWYLDYLLTWYPHMDGENVLCVYFENLKKVSACNIFVPASTDVLLR